MFDFIRKAMASRREVDEGLHAEAWAEFRSGVRRDGLWAKAIIEGMGDSGRTEAVYLRLLVSAYTQEASEARRRSANLAVVPDGPEVTPNWYFTADGRSLGPVTRQQLAVWIQDGEVGLDEQVFGPGLLTWRRVRDTDFRK